MADDTADKLPSGVEDPVDPTPADQTHGFNWGGQIPSEGAPGIFGKYKTWLDLEKAHREIQTGFNQSREQIKEYERQLAEFKKSPDKTPEPAQPQPFGDDDAQRWSEALSHYFMSGKLDENTLGQLSSRPIPPEEILDFLEYKRTQRSQFVESAKAEVEDFDLDALESWVASGESPYDSSDVKTILKFARDGDISWVKPVWLKFTQFLQNGGVFKDPRTNKMWGQPAFPERSGRPVGGYDKGFKSETEYLDALRTAKASGNRLKIDEVYKKLSETPEHIMETWRI